MAAGVDFKIKMVTVGGKRLKLTIWDTGNWMIYPFFWSRVYVFSLCELLDTESFFVFLLRCYAYSMKCSFTHLIYNILSFVLVCSWTGEVWNIDKLLLQRCTWNHPRYDRNLSVKKFFEMIIFLKKAGKFPSGTSLPRFPHK